MLPSCALEKMTLSICELEITLCVAFKCFCCGGEMILTCYWGQTILYLVLIHLLQQEEQNTTLNNMLYIL